ncbi:MAG: hypothetical protein HRT44_06755 [Bdellovibrionales bacterium]|nr:hypothetical protein [Bdellovibrionales bacterium]
MLILSISQWSWANMSEFSLDESIEQSHESIPDHPEPSEDCDDCESEKEVEGDLVTFSFFFLFSNKIKNF